jgi:hypothetical protein
MEFTLPETPTVINVETIKTSKISTIFIGFSFITSLSADSNDFNQVSVPAKAEKVLASFNNHEEACNMLCGKGQVRTQDLGYQSGAL